MAGHFLAGIELPRGMLWVDEFNWSAVQKTVERGITGAQIIDAASRIEGRPITLQAVEDQGWIRRATLLTVQAMADVPDAQYPLKLADGREFTVQFAADDPIAATPISRPELPAATHPYVATLRLITV
ncbi:hypothetical protein [Comamonas testosteroni]|uniref:hypothetical protein n=1 Tax=Comamonas testosteroni TaxID=285 RepID=UPI001E3ACB47|nr:hypothetical protein [Comamonas testosteroni]